MEENQTQTPPPFSGVKQAPVLGSDLVATNDPATAQASTPAPAEEGYIGHDVSLYGYGFIPVRDLPYRGNGFKTGMILLIVGCAILGFILMIAYFASLSLRELDDMSTTIFGEFIFMACTGIGVLIAIKSKFWAVKDRVFRDAQFVQADLESNDGFPFIMTDGKFGVVNAKMRRQIIRPEFDSIRYYSSQDYFECRRSDETLIYSTTGRVLRWYPTA